MHLDCDRDALSFHLTRKINYPSPFKGALEKHFTVLHTFSYQYKISSENKLHFLWLGGRKRLTHTTQHTTLLLAKQNDDCCLGENALTLCSKDLFEKSSLIKTGVLLFFWVIEQNLDRSHTERHTKRIEFKGAWLSGRFYMLKQVWKVQQPR